MSDSHADTNTPETAPFDPMATLKTMGSQGEEMAALICAVIKEAKEGGGRLRGLSFHLAVKTGPESAAVKCVGVSAGQDLYIRLLAQHIQESTIIAAMERIQGDRKAEAIKNLLGRIVGSGVNLGELCNCPKCTARRAAKAAEASPGAGPIVAPKAEEDPQS